MTNLLNDVFGVVSKDLLDQEKEKSKKLLNLLIDASVELKVSAEMIKIWTTGDIDDHSKEAINDNLSNMLAMHEKIQKYFEQLD